MPKDSTGSGRSLTKVATTVLMVVAAFLILKFVVGIAMSVMKWFFIAAAIVFAVWLFMGSDSKKSGTG